MGEKLSKEEEIILLRNLLDDGIITEEEYDIRKKEIIHEISVTDKNKTTAGLLALFFGGFGAHKFYLGNNIQGALHLMFCWTFIPSAISLIEGVVYLFMDESTFRNKVVLKHAKEGNAPLAIILIPLLLLIIFIMILFPS